MNSESINNSSQINSTPTQVAEPPKNTKNKNLPLLIIFAILAVAGIGFGGFELWQNIKKDDEIKNLQAKNTEVEEQKESIKKEDENIEEVIAPENYIYLNEFGVKIKKPEAQINEIVYYNGYPMGTTDYSIRLAGGDPECSGYFLDAPRGKTCNHIRITGAVNNTQETADHIKSINVDDVNLEVAFPAFGASEEIEKYFSDPSNYSKI